VNILAVGAHPDDIELGCGGTLLAHRARGDRVSMLVFTRGECGPQDVLSRADEQEIAAQILGATLYWGDFEDGEVRSGRRAVVLVERIIDESEADTVYVHVPRDSHQDHRAAAAATLAAARRASRVLLYESPTSQEFSPTLFVDIADHLGGKLAALRAHASQVLKNGLVDPEAVEAQARYRGFQARMRHAEAFESSRMAWDLTASKALAEELRLAEMVSEKLVNQ
jgi:LmbE family N-acetylglucosaminyl deacetylase